MKNLSKGIFIVFEGLDGSGKSTQSKLLLRYLKKESYKTANIDFPQYGKKSAGLAEEYLNGKYGAPEEVSPYIASIFYTCDRYDASFKLKQWLKEGRVVIADRYVASSIGHQGGKLKNKMGRKKFVRWLYNLEYNIFKVPRPDLTFILKTSPWFSQKLAPQITDKEKKRKRKLYLGSKWRDIHERDIFHLNNAFNAYLEAAKEFPRDFKVIECLENGKLLPPEIIHQKILNIINKIIRII